MVVKSPWQSEVTNRKVIMLDDLMLDDLMLFCLLGHWILKIWMAS